MEFNREKYDIDGNAFISYVSYSETGIDETAIVIPSERNKPTFFILEGNFVKDLRKLTTLDECIDFFEDHVEQQSIYSDLRRVK